MNCRRASILGLCAFVLVIHAAFAAAPNGPELPVNTTTFSYQSNSSIGLASDGSFVVVWQSREQDNPPETGSSSFGVYARVFNSAGVPQTGEILVNTTVAGNQYAPRVAVNASGNFIVVWNATLSGLDHVFARRYLANGSAIDATEFAGNTTTPALSDSGPDVALANDGSFVITYNRGASTSDVQVFGRRFTSAAVGGAEFQVSSAPIRNIAPRVAMNKTTGAFVVTWFEQPVLNGETDVYHRRYDATAAPLAVEARVNTTLLNQQSSPVVSVNDNGEYTIGWMTNQDGVGMNRIYGRRYDAAGVATTGEFMVNTTTTGLQQMPAVSVDNTNSAVFTWVSNQVSVGGDIYWTAFDATNARTDLEQKVNTSAGVANYYDAVASNGAGAFVVTWTNSGADGSVDGVFAQRFCANPMTYYTDADGDGYGDPSTAVLICSGPQPPGTVTDGTDCDDTNPAVHTGPTAAVSGSTTILIGNSATLTAAVTGTAPVTLNWSDGFVQVVGATPASVTRSVSPTVTTTYTVTSVTNSDCPGFPTGSATITVQAPPTLTAGGPLTRQQGSPATSSTIATVSDEKDPASSIAVTAISVPAGITISGIVNTNGTITANVVASCTATLGANNVTLQAIDSDGLTSTATLVVNVTANTPTALGSYPASTSKLPGFGSVNIPMSVAPLDNGTYTLVVAATPIGLSPAYSGPLSVAQLSGTISVGSPNNPGTYDLTVTATDNCGAVSTAVARLVVNETAPSATGYPFNLRQGETRNELIGNISDGDETPNYLTLVLTPPAGVSLANVVVDPFGDVTADVSGSCSATVGGPFNIHFDVTDTGGATGSGDAPVTIVANNAPTLGTYPNTTVNAGSGTTVTPSAAPSDDVLVTTLTANAAGLGALAIDGPTGNVTVPNSVPAGTYTVTVTAGDVCTTSTQTFQLVVNAPPVITGTSLSIAQGSAVTGATIASVSDPNDPAGSLVVTAGPAPAGITVTSITSTAGVITANVAIDCAIDPAPATVPLQVSDPNGATATSTLNLTILPNPAPILGTYFTMNVAPGGTASATPSAPPSDNGTVTLSFTPGTFTGGVSVAPNGVVTVTTAAPLGSSTITITGTDNCGATSSTTLIVKVGTAPTANPDGYTTAEDTTLTVPLPGVLGNDTDPDADPLTATLLTPAANGSVALALDGSFVYTPNPNFNGPDSFTYQVNDGTGNSGTAVATITVTPIDDPPVVAAIAPVTIPQDTSTLPIAVTASDIDTAPGSLGITATSGNTALLPNANIAVGGAAGNWTLTLTPLPGTTGTSLITVTVNDATSNVTTTFLLTVSVVAAPPVAVADSYTTSEDVPLTVPAPGVLGNDSDPNGDPITAVIDTQPAHGAITLAADGSFTYTPAADYNGPDSFQYHANDGSSNSAVVTVTLTVSPVNDAPTLPPGVRTFTVTMPTTTVAAPGLLAGATDVELDPLTVVITSPPAHGTLTLLAGGGFTYTPDGTFAGTDTFTYAAFDGTSNSNAIVVNLSAAAGVPTLGGGELLLLALLLSAASVWMVGRK